MFALVDHWCIRHHPNQLPQSCKIYLGYVKITNGVAMKSKWMQKTLRFTKKNVSFEKYFVHTLVVKYRIVETDPVAAHHVGEQESVSRIFLIISTLITLWFGTKLMENQTNGQIIHPLIPKTFSKGVIGILEK